MRPIDADKLKKYYAWWGEDSEYKQIFDEIIDAQPTLTDETNEKHQKEYISEIGVTE